jgi:hypothetical protein
MTLYLRFKRRVLNGFALNYTFESLVKILVGYLSTIRQPKDAEVKYEEINLQKIPCIIISLAFRNDRRNRIKLLLKDQLEYQFMNATHGKALNLSELPKDFISDRSKRYLSKGSIGCTLSHLKAWKAAEQAGAESCLFLEDDILLQSSIVSINNILRKTPLDYDIIFLGSTNKHLLRKRKQINTHFFEAIYPRRGMFAYILKINSINKIKESIFPINTSTGGLDTLIGRMVLNGELKAYHLKTNMIYADRIIPSNIINPSDKNKSIHYKEYF